ncbi:hypothetical protein [Paenibacillus sp. YIM B09110]|uniref:hypothetical protein n=1 Tax=Paenibacillus sp. YIM B09110 TaxID=3126102 RepID=UPI00301CB597
MPLKPKIKPPNAKIVRKRQTSGKQVRAKQVINPGFTDPYFTPWRDVGDVYLSTLRPNVGAQSAFYAVQPGRSASLTQRVTLGNTGAEGKHRLFFSVLADRNNNGGVLQVSFLNTAVSRTFPLRTLATANYQTIIIDFTPANVGNASSVELQFRVNGAGIGPSFMFLDTVVIIPI